MMDYLDVAFVLAMIVAPAVFTVFVGRQVPPRAAGADAPDLRAMKTRLWRWTGVAVGAYALLLGGGYGALGHFLWMSFFPLWFLLALPVLRAVDPGWRGVPRTSTRTASLARRDVLPPAAMHAWIVLTAVWMLLTLVTVVGLVAGAPGAAFWWLIFFPLLAGGELALFFWAGKRSLVEAEPHAAHETAEIRTARARLRDLKIYGWLGAAAACVLVFAAPAVILIWWGEAALTPAIIAGAGGGALAGIGGGVLGTMADLRRAKLNRLCAEEPTGDAPQPHG